ncbi:hypothetical protein HKD37_14G040490 [Glycine soja]
MGIALMVPMFHTSYDMEIEYLYLGACHSVWNSIETQADHHGGGGVELPMHDRVTSTLTA